MTKRYLILLVLVYPLWGQLPTVLSVQELLPCQAGASGVACTAGNPYANGVSRTNDVFVMGLPAADSDAIMCGGVPCVQRAIAPNINLRLQNSSGTQLPSQFIVNANWPDGHVKWFAIAGQASPTAVSGSQDTPDITNILCKVGTTAGGITCGATGGNFGGSNLATDNGTTISINTGVATFTVKKANFDVLDSGNIGVKNLLFPNSPGIVVMGPVADGVTTACSTIAVCNVPYMSSNDASSTASIEENGPVLAVIKAEGGLINGTITYMRFRIRMYFYKNSSSVVLRVALRNADEGGSSTFASSYKGHASYSIQLNPALGPGPAWAFGNPGATSTGTFTGTESAYLFQGFSTQWEDSTTWKSAPNCPTAGYCIVSPITRTGSGGTESYTISGYSIVYNGANLAGFPTPSTSPSAGWGDLTDNTGSGILVGIRYMAAHWPKEIKFTSSLITIGLNPDQSDWLAGGGIPNYMVWPDYHLDTVYLNFHNGALTSESNTFNSLQYPLIGKATSANNLDLIGYYNNATGCAGLSCNTTIGALIYPLVSKTEQDTYWQNSETTLPPCAYNTSPPSSTTILCWPYPAHVWSNSGAVHDFQPVVYHGWNWALSASGNQSDKEWGYLINRWLERGHTSAYINAQEFFKYEMEDALAHSDVAAASDTTCNSFGLDPTGKQIFHWRCASVSYLDPNGFPANVISNNASFGMRNWANEGNGFEHAHWYGLPDYFMMSDDMFAYDAMLQGAYDLFAETRTGSQQGTSLVNVGISRAMGHFLAGAARTYRWSVDVGDPTNESSTIGSVIQTFMNTLVLQPDFCPSTAQGAWPGRCLISVPTGNITSGVSRTRGIGGGFRANSTGVDNNGGGDTNCPILGGVINQACGKPWMDGIMSNGMWDVYKLVGSTELNALGISPTLIFDLINGINNWSDREAFILGPTGTQTDTKHSYDVLLNGTSPMIYPSPRLPNHAYVAGQTSTSANGSIFWLQQVTTSGTSSSTATSSFVFNATPGGTTNDGTAVWTNEGAVQGNSSSSVAQFEFNYYLLGQYQGSLTKMQQERFLQTYLQLASQASMNPDNVDDHDMYESSNVIYAVNHPGNTLSNIVLPTSMTPTVCTGVTSCTINWTAPTPPTGQGILSYRLKLDSNGRSFTEWIGYDPTQYSNTGTTCPNTSLNGNCFGFTTAARGCLDPVTGINSCSGDPVNTAPWFAGTEVTPAPANNVTSFVVTGLNPANTYHFALKALFGTGGTPPPPPPPSSQITTVQR